jgi:hypothetical protein
MLGVVEMLVFLVGEDYISCFKMNGSGNEFMDNIYHHGLLMFSP